MVQADQPHEQRHGRHARVEAERREERREHRQGVERGGHVVVGHVLEQREAPDSAAPALEQRDRYEPALGEPGLEVDGHHREVDERE